MSDDASLTYAALGDSTGVGVGARAGGGYPARLVERLARRGHALRLVNLCVSGAKVSDLLRGQVPALRAAKPAVATLGIGINDVTWGTPADLFARDYAVLCEALAATGARAVVVNVPDLSLSLPVEEHLRRVARERIAEVNGAIADAARRHGFLLSDLHAATEAELARGEDLLSDDGFHPSDHGYERWAELMEPDLVRAVCDLAA